MFSISPKILKYSWMLFGVLLLAVLLYKASTPEVLLNKKKYWEVQQGFEVNGEANSHHRLLPLIRKASKAVLWGTGRHGGDAVLGTLRSKRFEAPAILAALVTGFPDNPGNRIHLEDVHTGETLRLHAGPVGSYWKMRYWSLPELWQGKQVRLVAVDGSQDLGGWFGISSPFGFSYSWSMWLHQASQLVMVVSYAVQLLLLLVPGFVMALLLQRYYALPEHWMLCMAVIFSSVLGYVVFWGYFFHLNLGHTLSYSLCFGSGAYLCYHFFRRRLPREFSWSQDIYIPLLLWFFVGAIYVLLIYFPLDAFVGRHVLLHRFPKAHSDNMIPFYFAELLYQGMEPKNYWGDWLTSDRPPLQAGMTLLQYPLLKVLDPAFHYQVLGTILQCFWVPALWMFCREIGVGLRKSLWLILLCASTWFCVYQSFYVWPKMYGAAFVLCAMTFMFWTRLNPSRSRVKLLLLVVSAVCVALGMLAHGGVIFTVLGMSLMFLLPKHRLSFKEMALGACIGLLLYTPWMGYQKLYAPPGDRLIKMHLAGQKHVDPRSVKTILSEVYGKLSWSEIWAKKWKNVLGLMKPDSLSVHFRQMFDDPRVERIAGFHRAVSSTFVTHGMFLNLGWLVLLFFALRGQPCTPQGGDVSRLFLILVLSLGVWVLVMFGPPETRMSIPEGSYASSLILFLIPSLALIRLPALVLFALVGFNLLWLTQIKRLDVITPTDLAGLSPHINFPSLHFIWLSIAILSFWWLKSPAKRD